MPSLSWTHNDAEGRNRLDAVVAAKASGISRAVVQRIIRDGGVMVDGKVINRPAYVLSTGQRLNAMLPDIDRDDVVAVAGDVPIVYEDDDLVIVDKPAGIPVHPGNGHVDDTLLNHLLARYPRIADIGERARPGVVHRLDRDTSGLLIFALSQSAYEGLVEALKRRSVSRTYIALVHGHPEQNEGLIEAPVGRDPRDRTRQAVVSSGKSARTKYRVVRHLGPWSLLEVTLQTGRMHQIRVHMAAAGYPIAGDPTYGNAPRIERLDRQFLHASRLGLHHPTTGVFMEFNSQLPDDLESVLATLESVS